MKPRYIKRPPKVYKHNVIFDYPKLNPSDCGVYKITINDYWFYIGGSVVLKSRLTSWRTTFRTERKMTKNIRAIANEVKNVKFEIIEFIEDKSMVLERENFHIMQSFDDLKCLNHCPTSFSVKGVVKHKGYTNPPKGTPPPPKKIAQIDKNGSIVKIFSSIRESYKSGFVSSADCAKGRVMYSKGYIFRFVDDNGNLILPAIEKIRKSGYRLNISAEQRIKKSLVSSMYVQKQKELNSESWQKMIARGLSIQKPIIVLLADTGEFVSKFKSISEATRAYNLSLTNVVKVLKNKRKSHKGYIFKYA